MRRLLLLGEKMEQKGEEQEPPAFMVVGLGRSTWRISVEFENRSCIFLENLEFKMHFSR